jgi:potassium/chloride transporter 9
VLSIAMMWYLNLKYAGVTTVMWIFLFIVIYQTAHEKDWGDISQGILFKNITSQLQSLMPRKNCAKFWRATFMVLVQEHDLPLLQMCNHMTKDGLFIIGTAHVDNGTGVPTNNSTPTGRMPITTEALLPKFKSQHNVVKGSWLWLVEQTGLRAFVNVGAGSNLIDTYRTMISSAGLGGLTPNTVVVPYHESNRGAPSGNFVARVNEGLAAYVPLCLYC